MTNSGERETLITVCADGPLLVRGEYLLLDDQGQPVDPHRRTVALCRCGRSTIKPFCDGSHKFVKARATEPKR